MPDYCPADAMAESQRLTDFYGEPISTYSRADALADGTLVDAGDLGRQAGFIFPVALTRDVHDQFVRWSAEDRAAQGGWGDEQGRLWDLLYTLAVAMKARRVTDEQPVHTYCCQPRDGVSRDTQLVQVTVSVGPGDQFEPVVTISRPHVTGRPVE